MRRERPRLDDSPLRQSFARIAQLIANEQEQVVATQRAGMVAPAEAGMIAPAEEGMIAPAEEEGETEDEAWARWLLSQPSFPPLLVRPPLRYLLFAVLSSIVLILVIVFRDAIAPLIGGGESGDKFAITVLSFVSIPVVSIAFTYCHIWLALWMTFFPIGFIGCWQLPWTNVGFPVGWQGIVPWKGREMGRRACRLMTTHLVSVDEMLARLQPEPFAYALGESLDRMAEETVDAAGLAAAPRVWARLPERSRQGLYAAAKATTTHVIGGILDDLRADASAGRGFNLERLVDRVFAEDPPLVSAMFIACGYRELAFIRNMGAVPQHDAATQDQTRTPFHSISWLSTHAPTSTVPCAFHSSWVGCLAWCRWVSGPSTARRGSCPPLASWLAP